MWPRPELFCCTPRSIAITLLAIHILGVRPTSPCGSHLLPTQGSCFQLDSEWKKGALIFHTSARGCLQCLLTFRIIEQRSWVSPGSQASRRCVAAPIANAAVLLQGFCLGENFHVLPQDRRDLVPFVYKVERNAGLEVPITATSLSFLRERNLYSVT